MIYTVKRKLELWERKHLKDFETNKIDLGIIITDLFETDKYKGELIIPNKFETEKVPRIKVTDIVDLKEKDFKLLPNIIGEYTLELESDIINLKIY